jgi:hypothetical protein
MKQPAKKAPAQRCWQQSRLSLQLVLLLLLPLLLCIMAKRLS